MNGDQSSPRLPDCQPEWIESPLDQAGPSARGSLLPWLGSALTHGGLAALTLAVSSHAPRHRPLVASMPMVVETYEVDLEQPHTLPAPLPPVAAPPQPVKAVKSAKRSDSRGPRAEPGTVSVAPAAAQAGQVLARESVPEVLDFADSFVQGNAATHVGGRSASGGTASHAVQDEHARADGELEGRGPDRSRPARLAGSTDWDDCPFPEEAERAGVRSATVTLRVQVAVDGAVTRADVLQESSPGFGRETRRCALRKRWEPGRDRTGTPIGGSYSVRVAFKR